MNVLWNKIVSFLTGKSPDESIFESNTGYTKESKNYMDKFSPRKKVLDKTKNANCKDITKSYYFIATDFYEFGWGQSFHFAPRFHSESLKESIFRHEFFLASKLSLKPHHNVLDAGCGIMGPARNICRFSSCSIVGLTINPYQVKRSRTLNAKESFSSRLSCREGDFTETKFPSESFDNVYSIEAFCHVEERRKVFREMFRVLKKGGEMAVYDWVMTDKFDGRNNEHIRIKKAIERGNGIQSLIEMKEIRPSLEAEGFEVLEIIDLADGEEMRARGNLVPWYKEFSDGFSLRSFLLSAMGRLFVQKMCWALETVKIAPEGTAMMQKVLSIGAEALEEAGRMGIFTPLLCYVVRKPE